MFPPQNTAGSVLSGKRIAFAGKLGGMTKRDAQAIVRQHGGVPLDRIDEATDILVIGADQLPLEHDDLLADEGLQARVASGVLQLKSEVDFWRQLGLADEDPQNRKLYTPAMLAELLQVSVATIRRWHRRGLIVPSYEIHRLPYFDFQEVATARRVAELLSAGASPDSVKRKLDQLSKLFPDAERPLAQLAVIIEGKQILLRQGEGLIEPGGQLRIDFESIEQSGGEQGEERSTIEFPVSQLSAEQPTTPDEMLDWAIALEDEGDLAAASEMYRAVLAATGPDPETSFQLADLLYRMGDVRAARERYYMAIELDEDYVEARANLGCVLAELGQLDLAVAAFEGALQYHSDYPDVHYHLARTLDELGQKDQALQHWEAFAHLAPESPWVDEAIDRLQPDIDAQT